jgi:predicted metal-dependent enzyme (double-stranded beta helix superfamily)
MALDQNGYSKCNAIDDNTTKIGNYVPNSSPEIFDLEKMLEQIKTAAVAPEAAKTVRSILEQLVANPENVALGMREFEGNDVILFEDDSVSIWHTHFVPGMTVPAHDHQMSAVICVYRGSERNHFFENDPAGGIRKSGMVELNVGEVFSIGPNAIHTVTCISDEPCCGIHVYLGNLTEVERSLFDVDAGETMPFTDENYNRLVRPAE